MIAPLTAGQAEQRVTFDDPKLTVRILTSTDVRGVQNDILLDFAGRYIGSQLLVELDTGRILDTATLLPFGQSFDTFLALGDSGFTDGGRLPNIGGGAIDLPGNKNNIRPVFSASLINQTWNSAGGALIIGTQNFLNARLTLTPDAAGTVAFLTMIDAQKPIVFGEV